MAKIKKVYDSSYMVISNHIFEDPNITLKAKGLFGYLWSKPDDWDFFVTEIVKHFKGGRDQAMKALEELEQAGYLLRSRVRNELGQLTNKSTWLLSDVPKKSWIKQKQSQKSSASQKTIVKKKVQKSTVEKPVENSVKPKSGFPTLDNPILDNPTLPNTNITKYLNNQILNSSLSKSPSKTKTVDKASADSYEREEKINKIIFYLNRKRAEWHTKITPISKRERNQLSKAVGSHSFEKIKPLITTAVVSATSYDVGYLISMIKNLPENIIEIELA